MRYGHTPTEETAISDINVTPLVDVMLCLLIIFMIAIPTMTGRVSLDLPQRTYPPPPPPPELPMQLRLLADGRLYLDQQPISAELLAAELAYQAGRDDSRTLSIDADQAVHYEEVVQVLAMAKEQGIKKIAML